MKIHAKSCKKEKSEHFMHTALCTPCLHDAFGGNYNLINAIQFTLIIKYQNKKIYLVLNSNGLMGLDFLRMFNVDLQPSLCHVSCGCRFAPTIAKVAPSNFFMNMNGCNFWHKNIFAGATYLRCSQNFLPG